MISAPPHARILVASKPVDFRKGLPGLSALVETVLQEDPFAGDVFIFRSKRADRTRSRLLHRRGPGNPPQLKLEWS